MKQISQNLKSGKTEVVKIPAPRCKKGSLVIQSVCSLISSGTERMLVDFGKSSYLKKATKQPEKVKEAIQKIKTDGIVSTYEAIKAKLSEPMTMGYCSVGNVVAVGEEVVGFEVGDLVASNGSHAEFVCVPKNLCAKVPSEVGREEACFTVLASIALQSIRLIKPELGETIVVLGLGLVGLLTVQLLRSHGCRVIGIDYNKDRLLLAKKFGADIINLNDVDDAVAIVENHTHQIGADAVIIATATDSNGPLSSAAKMCRKRGRVVLVGVAGLDLSRADFFKKEITFQVSCSYGPGRYDSNYEEKGHDYPIGYVRWTEQRNFQAVLQSMKEGWLDIGSLISYRFQIGETERAYQLLQTDKTALGIVLNYPQTCLASESKLQELQTLELSSDNVSSLSISVIGSGNYSSRTLIPAFSKEKINLNTLYANSGLGSQAIGKKFSFTRVSTDVSQLWASKKENAVVIATRHDSHACYVCKALQSNKHVFVEKPLALTLDDIKRIEELYYAKRGQYKIMLGFNRRFSPFVKKMKHLLTINAEPMAINMTVNAGFIPSDHWIQDKKVGGGRIIGEACHFIDLARFLSGSKITSSTVKYMKDSRGCFDTAVISLAFSDGSVASINYFSNGNKSVSKERIEIFCGGKSLFLDNFRRLKGYGWKGFKKMSSLKQDKGQEVCVQQFLESIRSQSPSPIPFDEIIEVSKIVVALSHGY